MEKTRLADRGQVLKVGAAEAHEWARCLVASRMGSIELCAQELSVWVQVRGTAWVDAAEGRFRLNAGDWIAFSKESAPSIQADADGVCVGTTIADATLKVMARFVDYSLHVGHGRVEGIDLRHLVRLWYRAARYLQRDSRSARIHPSLRSLLLSLETIQSGYRQQVMKCPGGSLARKRQVFDRMQRARLFLEGNCHRIVPVRELAERTRFSLWYFSKVFSRLYEVSPQVCCANLRLAHAAHLLAVTELTIGEVSTASGFDNNCSFARSFRARYGTTASAYRVAARDKPGKHSQPRVQVTSSAAANMLVA